MNDEKGWNKVSYEQYDWVDNGWRDGSGSTASIKKSIKTLFHNTVRKNLKF